MKFAPPPQLGSSICERQCRNWNQALISGSTLVLGSNLSLLVGGSGPRALQSLMEPRYLSSDLITLPSQFCVSLYKPSLITELILSRINRNPGMPTASLGLVLFTSFWFF